MLGQGVTFPAGLRVLPSQEIKPKFPVGLSQIVPEGGKGTLSYYISNPLGLQMAY
jgi:hypothetical protein